MRYLLATLVCLCLSVCVHAADSGKPNTLTVKEMEDGWILLFDGKSTFGWRTEGDVSVGGDALRLGDGAVTRATPTMRFGDCELRLEYSGSARLIFDGGRNNSALHLVDGSGWHAVQTQIMFDSRAAGLESSQEPSVLQAKVRCNTDAVQFRFETPAGGKVALRNIKLRPHGLEPIFNGKDLTGWREFPGRKSKFTVTKEGWIHVKNGPGDLQTDGQWDDFVLQLDCRSNGDGLNSGVFFRCRPNEYQNGYEAQIHNGFLVPPGKEYTIEEYDPTSHKLIGKKKAAYTAMDYGTGAIYRRIPARFQAAKDYEWFTMTIVARGNHIATWVNGTQMVDWTDNRPPSDNARTGCKLGKGPISLQGHDPTTDLNFRNIRIAELAKESGISQSRGGK